MSIIVTSSTGPIILEIIHAVTIAVVFFILGFAAGTFFANRTDFNDNVRKNVAVFITAVWAVSIISSIVIQPYSTSVFIHAIMGSVVGYLFGVENPLKGNG